MNQFDLTGRRAVITGGAEGFGRAIAERFLASGAAVSLWDNNAGLLEQTARELRRSGNVDSAVVDIADLRQVDAATETTLRNAPRIDILVANAGLTGPNVPLWEYPPDDWKQVIDVNLVGTFNCCRAIVPVMQKTGYGRIVNIASVAGKEGNPNAPAYSASKAAVIGLTKSLGKELAKTNIRVNCVTPAAVRTAIFDQMTQQHIDFMLSKIPIGRFGSVDEIASLVCWLASEDCSFSTGSVFDASGGRATY